MKTLWILSLLALGCSSTTIMVKPCETPTLRVNPYEETLRDNPYDEPEKPLSCEEACLPSFTGCVQECVLGGTSENDCLTECVSTDDCLSQC